MKQLTLMICCHNGAPYIRRMLYDIFMQTLDPFLWEILIIFDGCTDESQLIFNNEWENLCSIQGKKNDWLKCRQLVRSKKEGLAKCKNFGLKRIDTDIVSYIDVDDGMFPQRLEIQLNFLKNHSTVDFLFTQAWDRDKHGRLLINCFGLNQYVTHGQIAQRLPFENVLMHGSFMGGMPQLRSLGFYNESKEVIGMEDWDLWLRALKYPYIFYKINERLSIYSLGTSVGR
jgi:glycosyltransferase involved in cell wall biosynthesis